MSSSKVNQYKELLRKQKEQTRLMKIQCEKLATKLKEVTDIMVALDSELCRIRTRKWYQFWKFLKRNQII